MWEIKTTNRFDEWYMTLDEADRENVLTAILVLRGKGPMLSRPYADSVYGSAHGNMKELWVQSKGNPIRAFFAFDPTRAGIILCAGEKTGKEKRFYDEMIPVADCEFSAHLDELQRGK